MYRVVQPDGQTKLQVVAVQDGQGGQNAELVKEWKVLADRAWAEPNHRGWAIVTDQLVGVWDQGLTTAFLSFTWCWQMHLRRMGCPLPL